MSSAADYNYRHFSVSHYFDGDRRRVRAGETAPSATLETVDGDTVQLSDCWTERPVVVEFGSATCPAFQGEIDRMNRLARRYADAVDCYVVYVREAHPGERRGPHQTMAEKRAVAREVAADLEARTVLVDDLEGTVHRAFDAMPNSVYLIGTRGTVAYRADWLDPADLERAIDELLAAGGAGQAVVPRDRIDNIHAPSPALLRGARRAFGRAGVDSVRDFATALPGLAREGLRRR